MPVPFRELDDPAGRERVAFLRLLPDPDGRRVRGGLLTTNGIGEPVEFTFTRIESPAPLLCTDHRPSAHVARLLVLALFERCETAPDLLLVLQDEVDDGLFRHRVHVDIPVAAVRAVPAGHGASCQWVPARALEPGADTDDALPITPVAQCALDRLHALDMVLDPFDRAARALDAVIEDGVTGP